MKITLSLAFLLIVINATAQLEGQPFIDSLVKEIPHTKDDTAKARLYKKISELYSNNSPAEAMQYAEMGMKHVTAMKWDKGVAVFHNLTGSLYNDKGVYDTAIGHFNKAYAVHLSGKDYFNAASALNNIGTAYLRQSIFDKATENYFAGLKLAEKINNAYMTATCLNNIATVYFNQNNYNKSLEYQLKALKIHQAENNNEGIAISYSSIANTYHNNRDTVNAQKYYQQALEVYREIENNEGIATVYTNLSLLLTDVKQKLDYQLKAQSIWDEMNPGFTTSITNMGNIAYTYMEIGRTNKPERSKALRKSKEWLDNGVALSIASNDMGNYTFLIGVRSELEAETGNYKNAYYDSKKFHELNDSIYSQENKNRIATIEGQREVALRDKEIELNKLALSVQKKQRIAFIAGIVLLCVIGVLLYWQNRMRKKTNTTLLQLNNELDEANKVKARFFAILSHDLRSPVANLVDFLRLQKEEPGLLSAEQTAFHQQKITASAEALLENMETMLLWSKEQMGNFKPKIKPVTVNKLFDYLQKALVSSQSIKFIFNDSQNLSLDSDESYLQVILYNLTSNAVKALKNTTNPVIEWKAYEENGKTVLSITDNGPGINEELLKIISSETTTYNNKTGLGLHLIRDLAKAINCQILLSNSGSGTIGLLRI